MLLGHVWQIAWSNPYTEPPGPRILVEMFVPSVKEAGARLPDAIKEHPRPDGYALCCAGIEGLPRQRTAEQRGKMRRRRLEQREAAKHPLFAEQFVEQELTARPEYFAGEELYSIADEIERVKQRLEYLLDHPNELLVYGEVA